MTDRYDVAGMLEAVREFQEDRTMTPAEAAALSGPPNYPTIPIKPCPVKPRASTDTNGPIFTSEFCPLHNYRDECSHLTQFQAEAWAQALERSKAPAMNTEEDRLVGQVCVDIETENTITSQHRVRLTPANLLEYLALKGIDAPATAKFQVDLRGCDSYEIDREFPVIATWTTTQKIEKAPQ